MDRAEEALSRALREEASASTTGESSKTTDGAAEVAAGLGSWSGVPGAGTFARGSVKALAALTPAIVTRLRKHLTIEDQRILESGDRELARGLGGDLAKQSRRLPILISMDTYEIIDETDAFVREVIRAAGPRVAWLIVGRRDLYRTSRADSEHEIDGYEREDGHAFAVLPIETGSLAREDIRSYFRLAAPDRPALDDDELQLVERATGAIPLAIELAAQIWYKTGRVEEIRLDRVTTDEQILDEMITRYQQHCVDELDKLALAAIAMAHGGRRRCTPCDAPSGMRRPGCPGSAP